VPVTGEQRQQRADLEPVGHHGQLRKVQGNAERPPPSGPAEQGQAVALVLPEQTVIEQPAQRLQQAADLGCPDAVELERVGRLPQQVLQP
jgi:hypothetical protein